MTTRFKLTKALLEQMRRDLRRPHAFAAERVGFVSCRYGHATSARLLILACAYHPVLDDDYLPDLSVGAVIGSNAFRIAMQRAWSERTGIFHVHLHEHAGLPRPSRVDLRETARFVPDFFHVQPRLPHGALILSNDSISGRVWHSARATPRPIDRIDVIGLPLGLDIHRHAITSQSPAVPRPDE